MLYRLERVADTFRDTHQLRSLPSLHKPGDFKKKFVEYMQGDKFHHYLNDTEPKVVENEKEMLYVLRTNFIIVTTLHKK